MKLNKKTIIYWIIVLVIIAIVFGLIKPIKVALQNNSIDKTISHKSAQVLEIQTERNKLDSILVNTTETKKELDKLFIVFEKQIRDKQKELNLEAVKTREDIEKLEDSKKIINYNKVEASFIYNNKNYNTEYNELMKATKNLPIWRTTADHIWDACESAKNQSHCYKYTLWVATAESSLFQRTNYNNGFWIMYRWKLKRYSSIEASIDDFVLKYNKYWYKHTKPQQRITKSRYCTSWCSNRINNVQSTIDILNNK